MADLSSGTSAQITPFVFNSNAVRVVMREGAPWFIAADVAKALGYSSPKDAAEHLDADEKGSAITRTPGGDQKLTIINESGLYALVLRSRKPEARKFAKWVTSEVLPAIRKTGGYSVNDQATEGLRIERSMKLADQLAAEARSRLFDVAMRTPHEELPHMRFLVSFTHDMRPTAAPMAHDATVLAPKDFAHRIECHDVYLQNHDLVLLIRVCSDQLASRAGAAREAAVVGKLKAGAAKASQPAPMHAQLN